MFIDAREIRIIAAGLILIAPLQSGCPGPLSGNSGAIDTANSVVEIEGAVDGLMGYIDFDGRNRAFFFGEKSESGVVTRFQAMAVLTADGRVFQYLFDESGRMVQMIDGSTTIDITYSDTDEMFTLSNGGTTETYALPDGYSDVLQAIGSGTELFASAKRNPAAATRPFSFQTFVKAVALPATALGGFVTAAAATSTSPILLGLAGVAALGATIKGAIDIAREATGRPLTPTEQNIRELADSAVFVNDVVTFGVNSSTGARFLTQAPNAPTVADGLGALKDALEGAGTIAPVVDQGVTRAFEIATADADNGNTSGSCGSILFINSVFSDAAIRVVTTNLNTVIQRNTNAPRMVVCESLSVQVFDTGGGLIGTFNVPFSAVDVPAAETPILEIIFHGGSNPTLSAVVEYLSLDSESLPTSLTQ